MMNSMNTTMMPFSPRDRGCNCRDKKVHPVPRMPIMIDQQNADPLDVRDLSGTPLHTVIDQDALKGTMLNLFTDRDQAEKCARSSPQRIPSDFAAGREQAATRSPTFATAVPPDGGYLDLFEHIDFDGCNWRLLEWDHHTVGNYADLWACGFLWWGWKNANDKVSSMDILVSANTVTFFDAPNLDNGDFTNTLWVPGNAWVPDLVPFGWNDRISSHLLWY